MMWRDQEDNAPTWDYDKEGNSIVGQQLPKVQRSKLVGLLREFSQVLKTYPGYTNLTGKFIETGNAAPV